MKKRLNPEEQEGVLQGIFTRPEVERLQSFLLKHGTNIERELWLGGLKKAGLTAEQFPFPDDREYWHIGFDESWCPIEGNEFSAIVEPYYARVVRSEWGIKGVRMDGMFPPQVNSRLAGEWVGYSFPPDLFEDGDIKSRIFRLTGDECKREEPCRQMQVQPEIGAAILATQMNMLESLFAD